MYRALIADDEPTILEGLCRLIDWEEYGVEIAGLARNGSEALAQLEAQKVDLLLTDIRMPKLDGLALIRHIRQDGNPMPCIILSGYDEFDYVKAAIRLGIENYLLKPVDREELSQTVQGAVERLENERSQRQSTQQGMGIFYENTLYRWLAGSLAGEELREKAALAGLDLSGERFTAAKLCLLGKGAEPAAQAVALCKERLTPMRALVCGDIQGNAVILFRGGQQRQAIREALAACVRALNELGMRAFASMGATVNGADKVPRSYQLADKMQAYSLLLPANRVADPEELTHIAGDRSLHFDFQAYARQVAALDRRACNAHIDGAIAALSGTPGITPEFARNFATEILFETLHALRQQNASAPEEIDFSSLQHAQTVADLGDRLKRAVGQAMDGYERRAAELSPHLRRILSYVRENVHREMTIKQLSLRFNINPAYLGQIFKNATGEMFTNYVNRLRIERAKELLVTTEMKTSAIADAVGYTNQNYFYRVFKRMAGLSASEYREAALNREGPIE